MRFFWVVVVAFLPFAALLAFPYIAQLLGLSQSGAPELDDVFKIHSGISQRIVPVCYQPGREPPAYDFTLVDQFNKTFTLSSVWSRPVVITFAYTYCPDVCPYINLVLNATLPALRGVVVVEVSLDPERDTPTRLFHYSQGNRYNWTFVTGPADVLEKVWRAYGVTRVVQQGYIAHDVLFVVVREGKVLGVVKGLPKPDDLARYIQKIINRDC
ncbi:SCO family protein [Pyrobaculum ferrireducens]|uniref:SenC-like protein n=1 Tax=Pyrobaculum ferrireducens TaxID=1104324 RepID=G7VI93_9CREN|nr:SCO family protein [Pyrobaculum ferrireducens]AET32185.1 senC-like protein [Pyrobaculum ferrireducens]